jgi:sugar/nucleoside kinase (ribokinase family)
MIPPLVLRKMRGLESDVTVQMTSGRGHIVGIGAVVMDHIAVLSAFPNEDTKTRMLEQSAPKPSLGGPTPVRLAYLTLLGWSTTFVGSVGDDVDGLVIRKTLTESGIGLDGLVSQQGKRSAFAHVWISTQNGSRTVAYSDHTLSPLHPDSISLPRLLAGARAVICDAREPAIVRKAANIARRKSIPVILDTGNYRPTTKELLSEVDVIQAPLQFVREMSGIGNIVAAAQHLRDLGVQRVVVTDGSRGCAYSAPEYRGHVPAFEVDVVDSLGAGDIFGAGLIHAWLRGDDFPSATRFAAAAAALKCAQWGKNTLATEDEIEKFLMHSTIAGSDSPRKGGLADVS